MSTSSNSILQPLERRFKYSVIPGLILAAAMLLVKLGEVSADISLSQFGLWPRNPMGLFGILSFPFLHADWLHLFSNLIPFVLLSTLIFNLFPRLFVKIYLFTFGLSGFWTWCFARPGLVIGASGWVYALLGFLLVAGFSRVSQRTMIVAGLLAFLYGGFVEGLVPARPNVSWEGHLMGLFAGALAAVYWRKELKQTHLDEQKATIGPAEPDKDPPYPFWLFNGPYVIDAKRNVIHPDDLIWENGRPYLKPREEDILPDTPLVKDESVEESGPKPIMVNTSANPLTGVWTYTRS